MKRSSEELLYNSIKWYLYPEKRNSVSFDEYTSQDIEKTFNIAKGHVVIPFIFDAYTDCSLKEKVNETIIKELKAVTKQTVLQSYRLIFLTKYVCNLLKENGIETVILKGLAAAREYPEMLYRKSGDVDLYLIDKSKEKEAVDVMKNAGFLFFEEDQKENHQTVLVSKDGIKIELHTMIIEPFSDKRANERIALFEDRIKDYVESSNIWGNEFPVLQRGAFAFTLLLHALQHFMRAGFGIKLLCDMAALFENGLNEKEKETYLYLVNDCRLLGFSEVILSVCVFYLGLDKDKVPHTLCGIEKCYAFLEDVLKAEEFGRNDSNRMAVVNGSGPWAYFKEFHHQTKLSFPKASKVFIIIPVLWVITLVRFLINNKKVRKTTAREIFKNAGQRSKMAGELEIFER